MEILDIIDKAQNGTLMAQLAASAEVDLQTARAAMHALAPELARAIADKASDPDEYQHLIDSLHSGEADDYLENSRAFLSRTAARDGESILTYLYGSLDAARARANAIGAPEGMKENTFSRFMTFAAVLVVAAMTRRNKAFAMQTAPLTSSSTVNGIMSVLVDALVKGVVDGFKRAMLPRRRRITVSYGRKKTRKRTRRKTPSRTPSLNDILGNLLKDAMRK